MVSERVLVSRGIEIIERGVKTIEFFDRSVRLVLGLLGCCSGCFVFRPFFSFCFVLVAIGTCLVLLLLGLREGGFPRSWLCSRVGRLG